MTNWSSGVPFFILFLIPAHAVRFAFTMHFGYPHKMYMLHPQLYLYLSYTWLVAIIRSLAFFTWIGYINHYTSVMLYIPCTLLFLLGFLVSIGSYSLHKWTRLVRVISLTT